MRRNTSNERNEVNYIGELKKDQRFVLAHEKVRSKGGVAMRWNEVKMVT